MLKKEKEKIKKEKKNYLIKMNNFYQYILKYILYNISMYFYFWYLIRIQIGNF